MSKAFSTGDIHIHPHRGNQLFVEIGVDYLNYLTKFSLEHGLEYGFINGDLFDQGSKIDTEVFVPVFEAIEKLGKAVKLIITEGNHDMMSHKRRSILESLKDYALIVRDYHLEMIDGNAFHFRAWTTDQNKVDCIESVPGCKNFLFGHLEVRNMNLSRTYLAKGGISVSQKFHKVFLGHSHIRQEKDNIIYEGNPYHFNYGDAGLDKGFDVVDLTTGLHEFQVYSDLAPTFKRINVMDFNKADCKNSFVQLIVDRKVKDVAKLKEVLYDRGAIEVDIKFEKEEVAEGEAEVKLTEIGDGLESIIKEYIEKMPTTLNKERLIKVYNKIVEAT
jgi:DNA repair exonuclease SbcCD nuclease subunit